MAAAACLRLPGRQRRRPDAPDVVDPVAVGADGREPAAGLPGQSAPVDAAEILLIRGLGMDVVFHDDRHVLVAARAGQRDIEAVDERVRIGRRLDDMAAVTIPAPGDLGDAAAEIGPAVDAVRIGRRARDRPRSRGRRVTGIPARGGREVLLGLVGRGPLPADETGVTLSAGERRVSRALERDMPVTFETGRRGGRPVLGNGEGRGEPRRGAKDDGSGESPIQSQDRPFRRKRRGIYFAGTGCLILSQAAAKSNLMPCGFSWQVRHCALMASGLP